jgi:hypothetical protein
MDEKILIQIKNQASLLAIDNFTDKKDIPIDFITIMAVILENAMVIGASIAIQAQAEQDIKELAS